MIKKTTQKRKLNTFPKSYFSISGKLKTYSNSGNIFVNHDVLVVNGENDIEINIQIKKWELFKICNVKSQFGNWWQYSICFLTWLLFLNFPSNFNASFTILHQLCALYEYVKIICVYVLRYCYGRMLLFLTTFCIIMCCDLTGSVGTWKSGALIVRYSHKKERIVFYCFENLSIAITLEPLVRFRWGF